MPGRYVICPVILGPDGIRYPKVQLIADSGKPLEVDPDTGQIYSVFNSSCVASDGTGTPGQDDDLAFCLVAGINMSNLNSDQEIEKLVDVPDGLLPDLVAALDETPNSVGMNNGQKSKLRRLFTDRNIDDSSLTDDTPFWQWGAVMTEHITGQPHDIRLLGTVVPE